MTAAQLAIALSVKVVLAMALVGVFRRGYHRRCLSFVAYAAAILLLGSMITFWPSRFWNYEFWSFSQNVYSALKVAIAAELAVRALAAFPGSWRLARVINTVIVLGSGAAWALAGAPTGPLIQTATIWVFAATALVATYFHLPVHAWHRALLIGFTAYLFVFSTGFNIVTRHQWAVPGLQWIDQFAYLTLVAWWAYAAWRPVERHAGIEPAVLRRLHLEEA